jgi:iron(III) transport system ATP-binding protein
VFPGGVTALAGVTFSAADREFVSLLGPSGSGKTTLLRVLAGLHQPTSGEVRINGKVVYSGERRIDTPTSKRDVGFVFQSFALWPHMTVAANIGYPLKVRHTDAKITSERVAELLALVGLKDMGSRYPSELSGGQQQRVALARSIAHRPALLLMDEPLSNLDARMRVTMRSYLRRFQQEIGITTVYVTHDRQEALALSDSIILLDHGVKQAEGPPQELFRRPTSVFAASFLADANVLEVDVTVTESGVRVVDLASGVEGVGQKTEVSAGVCRLAVSPRSIMFHPHAPSRSDGILFPARIVSVEFLGDEWRVEFVLGALEHDRLAERTFSAVHQGELPPTVDEGTGCVVEFKRPRWFKGHGQ